MLDFFRSAKSVAIFCKCSTVDVVKDWWKNKWIWLTIYSAESFRTHNGIDSIMDVDLEDLISLSR